jgi:hypothetical protein
MSLSHNIFSLPINEQEEAIRSLAGKAKSRREFDQLIRPLLHAKHAAGVPQNELKALRQEWRALFWQVHNKETQ